MYPNVTVNAGHTSTRLVKHWCHQKIGIPNFWHPCSNNPKICGTPIPIFLGLRDSTFDLAQKFGILERKRVNTVTAIEEFLYLDVASIG